MLPIFVSLAVSLFFILDKSPVVITNPVVVPPEVIVPEEIVATPEVNVHFVSAGGTDVVVVRSGRRTMLIGSSTRSGADEVVAYLRGLGVSRLDYLLLTENSLLSVGGAEVVLQNFPTDFIVVNGIESAYVTALGRYLSSRNLVSTTLGDGVDYVFGTASFNVFNARNIGEIGNTSLVVYVNTGRDRLLVAGDFGLSAEHRMDPLFSSGDILFLNRGMAYGSVRPPLTQPTPKCIVVLATGIVDVAGVISKFRAANVTLFTLGGEVNSLVFSSVGSGFVRQTR